MSDSELVRSSRDGDQFHYLWAAQRCLGLLSLSSDLVAVSIEGASSQERGSGQTIDAGEEVIDIGEYYGSQELASARLLKYMQLKHSTKHASEEWTLSGLKKTLCGFAKRCVALKKARNGLPLAGWLELYFITNRPISGDVVETIEDAAKSRSPRHPKVFAFLEDYCDLKGADLAEVCGLIRLEPEQKGFLEQRQLLTQGLRRYLPGPDSEAPLQLKELVTRKATTEFTGTPQITRFDVLKSIGSSEEDLFPARCLIELPARVVAREQEVELAQAIIQSTGQSLIVEADGGVGKSVLSLRLGDPVSGPFADQSLFFYSLHAKQWLLIALARAAQEVPAVVGRHVPVLREIALGREMHVLLRHFAADCLINVARAASGFISKSELEQLHAVNRSPFAQIISKQYERSTRDSDTHSAKATKEDPRFLLGYDFKKHWPDKLGRQFAVSGTTVERMIGDVVWDDWQLEENGRWDRDERGKRKHFERRNSYSFGDDERCSNLSNYLSYHAIMIVAGKLLRTTPAHTDPEDTEDGFTTWLKGHALTKPDGSWLADRRDPAPKLPWVDSVIPSEEEWPTSVQRDHFKKHLHLPNGQTIVCGTWAVRFGRRIEEVRVSSALVAPERATALVHALQCARSPFEHHLPRAGDDSEIDRSPFRLRGWIDDPHIEKGIDQYDPWAGSIEFPPYAPTADLVQMLGLEADEELRNWRQSVSGHADETISCSVWGTWEDPNQDDYYEGRRDGGRVLSASPTLLRRLCAETSMQLIFDVRVERNLARSRYGSESDDSLGYTFPYAGIFLLMPDGSYYSTV